MKIILVALCLLFAACARAALPSVFIEELTWIEVRDAIAAGASTAIYYAGSTEERGTVVKISRGS